MVLTLMNLSIFSLPQADPNRLTVGVTLALAVTALQFVIQDAVPEVPYLTIADQYTATSYLFLVSALGYSSAGIYLDIDSISDSIAFWVFFSFWMTYHLSFVCHANRARNIGWTLLSMSYSDLGKHGLLPVESIVIFTPVEHCKINYTNDKHYVGCL